ncbi:hypothetical protein B0T19DRAFT_86912 [Cercophora scortea]|uniref:Myb-like domain-containing protein n=1 Tax=Cercophora scortea TaxID=314031 RepID=A0AAE0IV67_9PEZI|nr:hypothetical protein B0T19DRAFT_86912 [Cercophora scortea]
MRRVSNAPAPGQGPSPLYPGPAYQQPSINTMAGRGQTNPYPTGNPYPYQNPSMDPYRVPTAQPPRFPEPTHSGYPAGQNRLPLAAPTTLEPNPLAPATQPPPPPPPPPPAAAIDFTDLTAAGASDPSSADDQPANNYGTWTAAEDRALLSARSRGHHWASIQRDFFPTKTANACRKRHERLMERQGTNHLDARRLERVAKEYMNMRQEMWSGLAARMGEPWELVEGQCMAAGGFKTIQLHARSYTTRRRRESRVTQRPPPTDDNNHNTNNSPTGIFLPPTGLGGGGIHPIEEEGPHSMSGDAREPFVEDSDDTDTPGPPGTGPGPSSYYRPYSCAPPVPGMGSGSVDAGAAARTMNPPFGSYPGPPTPGLSSALHGHGHGHGQGQGQGYHPTGMPGPFGGYMDGGQGSRTTEGL